MSRKSAAYVGGLLFSLVVGSVGLIAASFLVFDFR